MKGLEVAAHLLVYFTPHAGRHDTFEASISTAEGRVNGPEEY
ncbi:MAG TPA: hypothetical protein VGE45_12015 [Chloroflexia bacterium]